MLETMRTVLFVLTLIVIYILILLGTGWWTKKIGDRIVEELKSKGATSVATAISLPYDKRKYFNIGYRDYRPKALQVLISHDIVCRTTSGQYFLNKSC